MGLDDAAEEGCFDLSPAEEVVDAGEIGEFDVELGEVELIGVNFGGEDSHFHVLEVVQNGQPRIVLRVYRELVVLEQFITVIFDFISDFAPSVDVIGFMEDGFDDVSFILVGHFIGNPIAGPLLEIGQFEVLGDDIGQ